MRRTICALLLSSVIAAAASAQELRIGVGTEATTMDPHFYNLTPNSEATAEVFDTLVWADASGKLIPWLASSWKLKDDRTWDFSLRPGVTFSDGTPLTADDVLFTFARVPTVLNSPSSYAKYLSHVASAEALDEHTVRIHTNGPYPLLTSDLTQIAIISRKHGEGATLADYNSGKAAIGTGAYKLKEWIPGDRAVYVRNDTYWGPKPVWSEVTVKPLPNPATRTSALLSGTVDLINLVAPEDLATLQGKPDITIKQIPEDRLMYLSVDASRAISPFVTDRDGKPLDRNPMQDIRVRRAISEAIDRKALSERVMAGQAQPAGDLLPPGDFGTNPALKPGNYDPVDARKLLAEAGYPNGFGLTIHGPNDRYINDSRLVQTVAQFLSRVGIVTKVETLPKSVYYGRLAKREFSLCLVGTSPDVGTGTYSMLRYMLATRDAAGLVGSGNWNYYSNPKVDALLAQASVAFDDKTREADLKEAGAVVAADLPIIPLIFDIDSWAMRKGLDYRPRSDSYTLATDVSPVTH